MALAALAAGAGCATAPASAPAAGLRYLVRFEPGADAGLRVEITGALPPGAWRLEGAPGELPLRLEDATGEVLARSIGPEGVVVLPEGVRRASYRYPLAEAERRFGGDLERGFRGDDASWLVASASYLLRPPGPDRPLEVRFEGPPDGPPPLVPGDDARARDLAVSRFHAFGGRRRTVEVGGSRLELAVLAPSGGLASTDDELAAWVRQAAEEVLTVSPAFPLPRVPITFVPAADLRAASPFGMARAGTVAILVGERAQPRDLRRDWVLVHELMHFVHPRFATLDGPGALEGASPVWLTEGLATYLSILGRLRSGRMSEEEAWGEVLDGATAGRLRAGDATLLALANAMHQVHAYRSVYWGGALFALDLDLTLRRASEGQPSPRALDDVMTALREVRREVTLDDLRRTVDGLAGAHVFDAVLARHVEGPALAGAADLLARLGVREGPAGRASLGDGPLAAARAALALRR